MFENATNSKRQGTIGVGKAISYYCYKGYTVSLPINDSQEYDLIVEVEKVLKKVSVKTTSYKRNNDFYICSISTKGGNRSYNTVKKFDKSFADILFILANDGTCWEIPTTEINNTSMLVLGNVWEKYKI